MKILRRFGVVLIWVVALLLLAHATRGIAWGYEQAALQFCSSSTNPTTVYVPPSSASSWTVVGFEPLAAQGSISCGPSVPTAIIRSNAYPWKGVYTCTGYSLKIRQSSATHGCVSYIVGTPTPPSLGAISVDTDDVEDRISEIFILSTWLGVFLLFFAVFFGVLFYFRRR